MPQTPAEILVHGHIHSHLDFYNGLFTDMDKLKCVQNKAAR